MTCTSLGEGVVVCTSGGSEIAKVEDLGEKWCFRCRKRRQFTDTLLVPSSPWYEPWWQRKCERGHFDGDLFPGWSRDVA